MTFTKDYFSYTPNNTPKMKAQTSLGATQF